MKYILILLLTSFNLFGYDAFISVDTLKENLDNQNLIILDVDDKASYETSHILGAIHVEINDFIYKKTKTEKITLAKRLQESFIDLGINRDSDIVIYSRSSEKNRLNSSYLAFMLIKGGFNSVSILDGGYMAWVFKYNRLVSSDKQRDVEDGNYEIIIDSSLLVNTEFLEQNLYEIQIVDSRSPAYYFGTNKLLNIKSFGHIPNAKSSYYMDKFLSDFTLRDDGEIEDIFILGLDLDRDKELIIYGDDMFMASMNWFILYKKLGYINAKIYENGFSEWGNLELPTVLFKWE